MEKARARKTTGSEAAATAHTDLSRPARVSRGRPEPQESVWAAVRLRAYLPSTYTLLNEFRKCGGGWDTIGEG